MLTVTLKNGNLDEYENAKEYWFTCKVHYNALVIKECKYEVGLYRPIVIKRMYRIYSQDEWKGVRG